MSVSLHVCLIDIMEPEVCSPSNLPTSLRFRCSSMLIPGQWHHLAVVMAKNVKKSCLASVYFNGKAFGSGKVWVEENEWGADYWTDMCHLCIHASLRFLPDEVYTTIPWSLCLHGSCSCDWCVRTDRNTGSVEGACCSGVASGSCLHVWRSVESWDCRCHIHTRNCLHRQLPGFAQHKWVTQCCARIWSELYIRPFVYFLYDNKGIWYWIWMHYTIVYKYHDSRIRNVLFLDVTGI